MFFDTVGSKSQPKARGRGESAGVQERGERTKVICAYLGGLSGSAQKGGRIKRGVENQARDEGMTEVGLPHSSDEIGESRGSEGGNKSTETGGKTRVTQEVK